MGISTISQPIGEIIRLRKSPSQWYIDGVLWTGAIVTVGVGKDYPNVHDAFWVQNEALIPTLFLIDPGVYDTIFHGTSAPPLGHCFRGLGASATDTLITIPALYMFPSLGDSHIFIENIRIYAEGQIMMRTTIVGIYPNASLIVNKCVLDVLPSEWTWIHCISGVLSPYYGSGSIWVGYSKLTPTQKAEHLGWLDLSKVTLEKVSYTGTWGEIQCINDYISEDRAVDGTDGYGPNYGNFRITQSPLASISQPIRDTMRLRKPGIGALASYSQPIGKIINLRRNV
jgi:hypothetical protein